MKIFYGWRMVAAAGGIQFLQAGLLHQAFGAYFAVLNEERGWSKTELSGAAAMQSAEAALIGPALGWAIDRFGAQGLIRVGILLLGAGFVLLSRIDSLAGFYGAVIVIALGSSLSGFFPLNVAIIHWFERRRARALSFVGLGLALGGIFVPAVAWSMQTFGWRVTAFASGTLIIAVGFPLARVFRRHPRDVGETVDGLPATSGGPIDTSQETAASTSAGATGSAGAAPRGSDAGATSTGAASRGAAEADGQREFTAREALRTRAFWLLSLGHGLALLVVTAVNVHAITHMSQGLGYTVTQASLVITLMTLSQVAGVLVGGAIGDRIDKRRAAAACMLMHAGGLLMLTYATGTAMLVAFAVLHGFGWGVRGPFMQAIRADYFGRQSIGMILGLSSLVIALGQIGGPLLAGVFADATGNYRAGFTVLSLLAALGSVMFLMARRPA